MPPTTTAINQATGFNPAPFSGPQVPSTGQLDPNTGQTVYTSSFDPQPAGSWASAPLVQTQPTSGTGTTQTNTNSTATQTNPNAVTPGQVSQVQNYVGQLNDLYNQLFGNVANEAAFQRQGLEVGANQQQQQLRDAYTGQSYNLYNTLGARGLSDSSYSADAQNLANKTYQDQSGATGQNLALAEGQLGSNLGGQEAGWRKAQQNLGLYSPDYLNQLSTYGVANLIGNLGQQSTDLSQTLGTFGNQQGFLNALNLQAPSQVFTPQALQNQQQSIQGSSAPPFAQDAQAGAQGNPTDTNYWLNYFANLGK